MEKWHDGYRILINKKRVNGELFITYKIVTDPFWYNLVGYFYDMYNYGYDEYWYPDNGIEAWNTRKDAVDCLLEYVPDAIIRHIPLDLETGKD